MKKISVSVSYDEEKLSTLRLYLEQKGMQVEEELTKSLDRRRHPQQDLHQRLPVKEGHDQQR